MSGLFNIGGAGAREAPALAGLRVQTSVYGLPLPIVYGRARVAGNLIHLVDFTATQATSQTQRQKVLGVIPVPAREQQASGYQYKAAVALALCEGPITGIGDVWVDKEAPEDFATVMAPDFGWALFTGTGTQAPWSYLTSNHPGEAVPYQFTAYVANSTLELPNATLLNYSWEVKGFLEWGGGIVDANPASIIYDLLTAANYGVGFPASKIDGTGIGTSFYDFQSYCAAAGLFCSPVIGDEAPARSHLDALFEIGNTAPVWSDGVLKFRPYGDVALTANGRTYTPNTTPLYDLTDNDYLPRGDNTPPVTVRRRDPAEVPNVVTVEIEDRAYDYNATPYKAEDLFEQLTYGPRALPVLALHGIKSADVGRTVAQIRLQREQNVRNTYDFRLGLKYSLLEPMDLVTLTDSGLQLSLTPVRITSVVELQDEEGFAVTAEDWPLGTANASLYGSQGANGYAPDTNATPGSTSARVIQAAPDLQQSGMDLWIGATGGDNWGGCDVYVSWDNTSFVWAGRIVAKAAIGQISPMNAATGVWPSLDTGTPSCPYFLIGTGRTMTGYSATDFSNLVGLMYVEAHSGGPATPDEWLAIKNASFVSTNVYDIGGDLYRGLYGTESNAASGHNNGSWAMLIDEAILSIPFPNATAGQTVYFKFPAFNKFGNALQSLAAVSSQSFTFTRDAVLVGDAIAQVTVSVNPDGSWSATWDGPEWVQSVKYGFSTSAFPSDATIIASGTVANGRTLTVTSVAGSLTLGQTLYLTVIPYRGLNATGLKGQSIHGRASFQDYSTTRTVRYTAMSLMAMDDFSSSHFVATAGYVRPNATVDGDDVFFRMLVPLPDGVTVTNVTAYLHNPATGAAPKWSFVRIDSTGGSNPIIANSAGPGTGWIANSNNISEATSGRRYAVELWFDVTVAAEEADYRCAAWDITYTRPSTTNT